MNRDELLDVVKELRSVITEKKLTPRDALLAAEMLKKNISDSIEQEKERYMTNGEFK